MKKGERIMNRKHNAEQRTYALAKAHLETLKGIQDDMERKYIFEHGITNKNGEIPARIYCIDDNEAFELANQEFSELPESKSLWQEILEAEELLKQAEEQLIIYGLSIAPAKQREILAKAAETNYTTRIKIIDLVMRLDVATVR